MRKVQCLIIGSGPAGYTAAIYASRANLKPVMVRGYQPGGQLTTTTEVENFPGYAKGITGVELMTDLQKQAERFGTEIIDGLISKVDFSNQELKAWTESGDLFLCDSVIITTGATAKYLNLESEQHYLRTGGGVSACAICDGFFYKDQEVAIVGAGDSAAEEALYLANICKKVNMIVRKGEFRASKIMQERVLGCKNLVIHYNTETIEILGDGQVVEAVKVKNNISDEITTIPITGFFVAIGHKPNTEVFKDFLHLNENGYIIKKPDSTKTNIEGVFVAGDVADYTYRQAITAAGTGCMAALDAERYLSARSHN